MAKSRTETLADRLHAGGLRKRVAQTVADTIGDGRRTKKSSARNIVSELRSLANEIEDRATNGPGRRKAAAKKAAATRKRNATKRSTAAKKGARTRAKAKR